MTDVQDQNLGAVDRDAGDPSSGVAPGGYSGDPLVGTIIGDRYRIERVLGSGGMGTVYQAEHVLMEKRVALKVLHPTFAVVTSVMDRFKREAIALSRIAHPNVVSASDFGKLKNGAYYLALEYVEGKNLAEVLETDGAFAPPRALWVALQIAQALCAAHADNIVHRDLKPHNVMITSSADEAELVKVLDFGLAKLRSKNVDGSTTNVGSVFGTPHYMAPEQITGVDVDGRADLYSLGLILHEMLTGRRPFDGKPAQVLDLQVRQPPPPLPAEIAPEVRSLVERLLAKNRDQRPASASEVVSELEAALLPYRGREPNAITGWMTQSLELGRFSVPRWGLFIPIAVFLSIFALGSFTGSNAPESAAAQASSATPATPARSSVTPRPVPSLDRFPQIVSQAEFGDAEALKLLLEVPPKERSEEIWLVLGQGHIKSGQLQAALELYREAIIHQPELAENAKLAAEVRRTAADDQAGLQAVQLAAEALGRRGVDLLFSVWADTSARTPATALAQRYLEDERVLQRASEPVRLALALRESGTPCARVRELLEKAKMYGDTRSVRPMLGMRKRTGCGPARNHDCYSCLRQDELLAEAIRNAAQRKAPKY